MITRTPYDRDNLKIGKKDKVLEVGPGHSPTFRSNVLVDLFVDSKRESEDLSTSAVY